MLSRIDCVKRAIGVAICLQIGLLSGRAFADDDPARPAGAGLRVLIITGRGAHDWRATVPILRRILADTGRFDVRVCEAPDGLTTRTLGAFDVLIDDCGASAFDGDTGKAIASFVESGKGLVITQGALRFYESEHGLARGRPEIPSGSSSGAVPGRWPAFPSGGLLPSVQFLELKITQPGHPVVQGCSGALKFADAVYRGMAVNSRSAVIAMARTDEGTDEPALVLGEQGKGRVFLTALGHDLAAMQEPQFITAFARGTEWAATGKVTLPPELGPPRPSLGAVKGLVITGGHDHETAFYTLFEGYKDVAWLPVATSATAFQSDLRGKYDVLIMYDFTRDLDENGKKNLRDFVESGKGVVVLHHALLNYQNWPWWYEQVVGGRYRLKSEEGIPSSTVKNDQDIFVTPAETHPVTAGIGKFHIIDETYKRMGFSPGIRPLLTTDNPNSDRSLAWIGPGEHFRVVAIQLGHGHTAFRHPKYRALVHNAILWSAGRGK